MKFLFACAPGRPWKLLLVNTGNISTRDLKALFTRNLPAIEKALQHHTLVTG